MEVSSQLRGIQRVLAREVHVSDLLQHLTDLDPKPWESLVGFIPETAGRERLLAKLSTDRKVKGTVDLVLGCEGQQEVAIEVKVGHRFSADQQARYQKSTDGRLILAGLHADRTLVRSAERWEYLNLGDVFQAWVDSPSEEAVMLAKAAANVMHEWDAAIDSVFGPREEGHPLISIGQKFLAVVIARRIAAELEQRGLITRAGVTSGSGGLAIVQTWAPIQDDRDRRFIAEVRWHEGMQAGELRIGVDYYLPESREARAEVWDMAKAMDDSIRIDALHTHLVGKHPQLADLLLRVGPGRKPANDGAWGPAVDRGFRSTSNPGGVIGGRLQNNPGFVGDGTQRFEAVSKLDYSRATATDLIELLEASLEFLKSRIAGEGK